MSSSLTDQFFTTSAKYTMCSQNEVLFYHHIVRKWSPITQIWTYLTEGTASQMSKHLLFALGAFHPFQNMALDSRKSKIVILQKEILRNRNRYDLGSRRVRWLVFIQNAIMVLFLSCNFSKETWRSQDIFDCMFNLIGGNYFIILCWFLTYINLNWPEEYMCLPEHPSHLPP